MKTVVYAECDVCDTRSSAFDGAIYTRQDAWQILHEQGWTRRQLPNDSGLKHKCPECGTAASEVTA